MCESKARSYLAFGIHVILAFMDLLRLPDRITEGEQGLKEKHSAN